MAKVEISLPEDFLLKLSKLEERTDEIIPKVLKKGAGVVLEKVKSNLRDAIGKSTKYKSRATGKLASALGISLVKQDRDGNYNVKIGFSEPREGGESNAKIANILEYGKSGQPPRPFLKPAKTASQTACIEAMNEELERELSSL